MINPQLSSTTLIAPFWERILTDGALHGCEALEKLLVGCEIIAALDDLDLLEAA